MMKTVTAIYMDRNVLWRRVSDETFPYLSSGQKPVWTILITPGKYFGFCIATQMFEHVTIAWFGIGANLEWEAHDFHPQFPVFWNLEHLGRRCIRTACRSSSKLIFAYRFGYHMTIRYTYLAAGLPCLRVLKIWYNLTFESDFILFASWLCVSVVATHIWHLIYHVLRFLQI